jgi:small subunit ribosomal protein S6
MSANVYECMFLLDANKVAGDVHAAQAQLHGILEKHSAEILASRPWDERRLSYPVNGHKKGLYYLTYFKIEGRKLVDIEQDVKLNETILRSMVLRIEPKLVDTMLAIARDEHATALPSGTDTEGFDGGGDDGHRRGRRPMDGDKD